MRVLYTLNPPITRRFSPFFFNLYTFFVFWDIRCSDGGRGNDGALAVVVHNIRGVVCNSGGNDDVIVVAVHNTRGVVCNSGGNDDVIVVALPNTRVVLCHSLVVALPNTRGVVCNSGGI